MRGQVTTKPGIVTSNASVDQSFFSNSGLVDYHGGFGVSKAMDAPPMGPVNAHYEPVTEMASEPTAHLRRRQSSAQKYLHLFLCSHRKPDTVEQ